MPHSRTMAELVIQAFSLAKSIGGSLASCSRAGASAMEAALGQRVGRLFPDLSVLFCLVCVSCGKISGDDHGYPKRQCTPHRGDRRELFATPYGRRKSASQPHRHRASRSSPDCPRLFRASIHPGKAAWFGPQTEVRGRSGAGTCAVKAGKTAFSGYLAAIRTTSEADCRDPESVRSHANGTYSAFREREV
jgi:hypothetical protein